MMDRRTQRALLIVLFFGVAVIFYRTLGVGDHLIPQRIPNGKTSADEHTLRVDPKKLDPANATLGVRTEHYCLHA